LDFGFWIGGSKFPIPPVRVRGKRFMDARLPVLRDRARQLRRNQTDVENKLWSRLRTRQLGGAKFRRQYPVGNFIVDFCCFERHLVVELDGGQHAIQTEADQRRSASLSARGYRVLRFWDNEVIENIDGVLEQIKMRL
ncbi:MAG: endonuclease domain-containing protein, partial [Candidatus Binatia bacterium]